MTPEQIGEYILSLIAPLSPSASCIHVTDNMGVLYTITVPDESKGKVIGRTGETINSIRHIVAIVGRDSNIRASVKVI